MELNEEMLVYAMQAAYRRTSNMPDAINAVRDAYPDMEIPSNLLRGIWLAIDAYGDFLYERA